MAAGWALTWSRCRSSKMPSQYQAAMPDLSTTWATMVHVMALPFGVGAAGPSGGVGGVGGVVGARACRRS